MQSESRIPASTWRQWCERLQLSPSTAVELWDEVCHPMMLAGGQTPDVALILQLRASRPDVVIDDFRDELPAVLLSINFIDSLHEEGRGPVRAALLRLYRYLGGQTDDPIGVPFVAHAGTVALLDGVLPEDLTIARLIKVLTQSDNTLVDLCRLGHKALAQDPRREVVGAALEAAIELVHPSPAATDDTPAAEPEAVEDEAPTEANEDTDPVDEPTADADSDDPGAEGEDHDEGDEQQEPASHPREVFVHSFRRAAAVVYATADMTDADAQADRLQAIQAFQPLSTRIPSMEEARQIADRPAGGGGPRQARTMSVARPTGGGAGPRMSAPKTVSRGSGAAATPRSTGAPRAASAPPSVIRDKEATVQQAVAPNAEGKLPAPTVTRHDLDAAVAAVSTGLTTVRETEEVIWQLFTEDDHELASPRSLATELATEDSSANKAADALRLAAQQQRVRTVLDLPPDRRMKDRRFDLEADGWLNAVNNYRRSFDPDSRYLISLPKVLDHAAAALVRVEALRAAVEVVNEATDPEQITQEAVTARYEGLLAEVTYLADSAVVAAARQRADADAAAVLAAVAADTWIAKVREGVFAWVDTIVGAGATESINAMTAALEKTPLVLDAPAGDEAAAPFSDSLAADTALGEIVDALRVAALRAANQVLRSPHRPEQTLKALDKDLKGRLRREARITLRRERHQRNPRVALPVVSLERLSGNPELSDLFVRLTTDGRLLFLEDYEDGSFIDVFELRESKKRQMHARARERARDAQSGELQTGSSYLHTLGRTSDPFGSTPTEVLAACVVDDDGERIIFEPF